MCAAGVQLTGRGFACIGWMGSGSGRMDEVAVGLQGVVFVDVVRVGSTLTGLAGAGSGLTGVGTGALVVIYSL